MSVASVYPADMLGRDHHHSNLSSGSESIASSLEELQSYFSTSEAVLSIEELRNQLNSCFSCGVNWYEDHVSLDCSECGGYSMQRPCPVCDGKCKTVWKRDLTMSQASGKARWQGACGLQNIPDSQILFKPISNEEESLLCTRFEKLRSSS